MASPSVVRYIPLSSQARKALLVKLLDESHTLGADVTQHVICTPLDAEDDGPILSVTVSSAQDHQDTDASLMKGLDAIESEGLLKCPPEFYRLDPILGFSKEALRTTDLDRAMVLFAIAEMYPGTWDICMPAIRNVTECCEREEPGTLAYQICKDKAEGDTKGYVIEIYESIEYFQDPHMNAQPVQEVLRVVGEHADYKDFLQMRILGGFLAR